MERVTNDMLRRQVLDGLTESYGLANRRDGVHLSSLLYCLTKAYLDDKQTMGPTDEEVLLFSTGFALEEVLIPKLPNVSSPVYEVEGVYYRPDFVLQEDQFDHSRSAPKLLNEIKSTRRGVKSCLSSLSEKWMMYQMAGCHMMNTTTYNLITLCVSERPKPELLAETITYTPEEIADNWEYITTRRDIYVDALARNEVPLPYEHCESWECNMCRYALICDSIMMSKGMTSTEEDADADVQDYDSDED